MSPEPKPGEKTLAEERFTCHRPDARGYAREEVIAYLKLPKGETCAGQFGTIGQNVVALPDEIALG